MSSYRLQIPDGGGIGKADPHENQCKQSEAGNDYQKIKTQQSSGGFHAHFDCFSGAAGDMMLASCIDASPNPSTLLELVKHSLNKGITELDGEFDIRAERVCMGKMGSISAMRVHVDSIYKHEAAPVPGTEVKTRKSDVSDRNEHSHDHSHAHIHERNLHNQPKQGDMNISRDEHHHSHSHDHSGPLRNLPQIKKMLLQSSSEHIPPSVRDLAIETFTELAIAESYTHGTFDPETVHFHEVGAVDSIVDIVGTLIALYHLQVKTVSCSRLPMGEGMVWTDHGQLPVPAFATLRLLIGMKTCRGPGNDGENTIGYNTGELVTPTAVALLRVLTGVAEFERKKHTRMEIVGNINSMVGRAPDFTPRAVGIGGGTKDFVKHSNVMRIILGDDVRHLSVSPLNLSIIDAVSSPQVNDRIMNEPKSIIDAVSSPQVNDRITNEPKTVSKWKVESLTLVQANLDDITPEILSHTVDILLQNEAVDAWVEPIVMKKGRSAHTLNCLCHQTSDKSGAFDATHTNKLLEIIFRHTTTLGIRIQHNIERAALHRQILRVQTKYGVGDHQAQDGWVDVKIGKLGSEIVSMKAEFDHCKIISEKTSIPIKLIADDAKMLALTQYADYP